MKLFFATVLLLWNSADKVNADFSFETIKRVPKKAQCLFPSDSSRLRTDDVFCFEKAQNKISDDQGKLGTKNNDFDDLAINLKSMTMSTDGTAPNTKCETNFRKFDFQRQFKDRGRKSSGFSRQLVVGQSSDSDEMDAVAESLKSLKILESAMIPSPVKGSFKDFQYGQLELKNDQEIVLEKESVKVEAAFVPYVPKICSHESLKAHPDILVETVSMSSVTEPTIANKIRLPSKTLLEGLLTQAQIEVCLRANAQHELFLPNGYRKGFFVGDGAGVGKGRQQAGIMFHNFLHGRRKAVWFSISADLIDDARKDSRDIGAEAMEFHDLRSFKKGKKLGQLEGILFCTYSLLVSGNRKDEILEFCGEDFEGVLSFDEMHRAKNLGLVLEEENTASSKKSGSKTALAVQWLQENLPLARVVYVSATGATEPEHLLCLPRLGLWGPGSGFETKEEFVSQIKKSGHGAMEMVCMHMKAQGQYVSRSLSFQNASFDLLKVDLNEDHVAVYDASVSFWNNLIHKVSSLPSKAGRLATLWSSHQRFFEQMIIAAKLPKILEIATAALDQGKCVVIGLQSTGESVMEEGNYTLSVNFSSTCFGIVKSFLSKHCSDLEPRDLDCLVDQLENLRLPSNPLDVLIHSFGGPEHVAEMTGRTHQFIFCDDKWMIIPRKSSFVGGDTNAAKVDSINLIEREMFQNGSKLVAIISQAASTGVSLHSDRRFPWSAERAVQQLGRTHRSNQNTAPQYKLIVSPIGGEWRFASAVANRLQSLGALTQGDRRAATGSSSFLSFSIEPTYGLQAVMYLQTYIFRKIEPYPVPDSILSSFESKDFFFKKASKAFEALGLSLVSKAPGCTLKKFLNRILGMPVKLQNAVFELFCYFMDKEIEAAKSKNVFIDGVFDFAGKSTIRCETVLVKSKKDPIIKHFEVETDRGISWECVLEMKKNHSDLVTGFYKNKILPREIVFISKASIFSNSSKLARFHLVRPNTGAEPTTMTLSMLKFSFRKIVVNNKTESALISCWNNTFQSSSSHCHHKNCFLKMNGACNGNCNEGRRVLTLHVLSGQVFPFWKDVESLICQHRELPPSERKIKVVRVALEDGHKVVGMLIPSECIEEVTDFIRSKSQSVFKNEITSNQIDFGKISDFSATDGNSRTPEILKLLQSGIWEFNQNVENASNP